jgi:ABC-type polysaccharide/polyol phosphate export permease
MLLNNNLAQLTRDTGDPSERPAATYANLHLLRELIKRDFNARFTGSALGVTWAVLQPLSFVVLYWFVFTFMIPGGRAGGTGDSYIYFLIAGLIPWLGVNEGLIRSTTAIVENAPIVRRLPLKGELLVIVPNASALIFECVGLVIFLTFVVARGGSVRYLWLLPVALALQFALQLGIGFVLAASYVFFRDLTQAIGFVLSIVFYLSPILYPVGGRFQKFFFWNPLTALLGLFRSALLAAPLPDGASTVFLLIAVSAVFTTGLLFFRRAQPTLVDLI